MPDGSNELPSTDFAKFIDIRRGKRQNDLFVCSFYDFFYERDAVAYFFCSGWTYLGTMTAINASFFNNICLIVLNPNGFYRSFPDAFIAVLAILRLRINRSLSHVQKYSFTNIAKILKTQREDKRGKIKNGVILNHSVFYAENPWELFFLCFLFAEALSQVIRDRSSNEQRRIGSDDDTD